MNTVRLPDLWLKMEMARAVAWVPPGESTTRLMGGNLIRCIRGDGEKASTFNKWLAGDTTLRIDDDVGLLAALLKRMIQQGLTKSVDRATIESDARYSGGLALKQALLGTVCEFAVALVDTVGDRDGAHDCARVLDNLMRRSLMHGLVEQTDPGGEIVILHGTTRDWARSGQDGERVARGGRSNEIPRHDFIQYIVPPSPTERLVFGFEMMTEHSLVGADWTHLGGWFPPQVQLAGKALMLLDEPVADNAAYRADGRGEGVIQIVSVDLQHLSTTAQAAPAGSLAPYDLYRLTRKSPTGWPGGYAQTMAMLTYVKRLVLMRTRKVNKVELTKARAGDRESTRAMQVKVVSPLPRLHQASYRVV